MYNEYQEVSLKLFELCDMVCWPGVCTVVINGWTWTETILR